MEEEIKLTNRQVRRYAPNVYTRRLLILICFPPFWVFLPFFCFGLGKHKRGLIVLPILYIAFLSLTGIALYGNMSSIMRNDYAREYDIRAKLSDEIRDIICYESAVQRKEEFSDYAWGITERERVENKVASLEEQDKSDYDAWQKEYIDFYNELIAVENFGHLTFRREGFYNKYEYMEYCSFFSYEKRTYDIWIEDNYASMYVSEYWAIDETIAYSDLLKKYDYLLLYAFAEWDENYRVICEIINRVEEKYNGDVPSVTSVEEELLQELNDAARREGAVRTRQDFFYIVWMVCTGCTGIIMLTLVGICGHYTRKRNKQVVLVVDEVGRMDGARAQKVFRKLLIAYSHENDTIGFNREINSAHNRYLQRKAELVAHRRTTQIPLECNGESTFDGTVLQRFGWTLLCNLVTAVTCGLAYPATLCWKMRWQCKHTVYNGKRLSFDGRGIQLLGKWICWLLLTVITMGIYGLWIPKRLEQWKAKHTHIAGEDAALGGTFDGSVFALFGLKLLSGLLTVITFGLATTAVICMQERYKSKHRIYDGRRLSFDGRGIQLFGKWILWSLLTLVTLSVYAWWIPNKMLKWKAQHTKLQAMPEAAL